MTVEQRISPNLTQTEKSFDSDLATLPIRLESFAFGFETKFVPNASERGGQVFIPDVERQIQRLLNNSSYRKILPETGVESIHKERDRVAEELEKRARELSNELHSPVVEELPDEASTPAIEVVENIHNIDDADLKQYHLLTDSRIKPGTFIAIDITKLAKTYPFFVEQKIKDFHFLQGIEIKLEHAKNAEFDRQEEERKTNERICTTHALENTPIRIRPLIDTPDFDSTYIIDQPDTLEDLVRDKISHMTSIHETFYKRERRLEKESLSVMRGIANRARELSTEEDTPLLMSSLHDSADFIQGSKEEGYHMKVNDETNKYGNVYVDVNLTALAQHDPHFVSEQLLELKIIRSIHEMLWSADRVARAHTMSTRDHQYLFALNQDPEKNRQESAMIKTFMETMGGLNEKFTEHFQNTKETFKPHAQTVYDTDEEPIQTIGGSLRHRMSCPTEPEENKPFILNALRASEALSTAHIELGTDSLMKNPLEYTDTFIDDQ